VEVEVLAVGKLRSYYREACDDYARRLKRYLSFSEQEIKEASRSPTTAVQLSEEARRLTAKLRPGSTIVALTRVGSPWSTRDLAGEIERWLVGSRPISLVIGGSRGLDTTLVQKAGRRWSLGPLTLPHELARVVVFEQLYRAFTILKGEPYHKGA
jgi:23S rRNA (pseudouridine1915-N3)-methyltransferase